jgi:hypothetical protein
VQSAAVLLLWIRIGDDRDTVRAWVADGNPHRWRHSRDLNSNQDRAAQLASSRVSDGIADQLRDNQSGVICAWVVLVEH